MNVTVHAATSLEREREAMSVPGLLVTPGDVVTKEEGYMPCVRLYSAASPPLTRRHRRRGPRIAVVTAYFARARHSSPQRPPCWSGMASCSLPCRAGLGAPAARLHPSSIAYHGCNKRLQVPWPRRRRHCGSGGRDFGRSLEGRHRVAPGAAASRNRPRRRAHWSPLRSLCGGQLWRMRAAGPPPPLLRRSPRRHPAPAHRGGPAADAHYFFRA